MKTRRPFIPQRKPIFVGCEGESEQGYTGFLQDLIHEAELHVHLNIVLLKAGDPLARVELAIQRLNQLRKTRVNYADRFLLLDTDQLATSVDRANRARQLAAANDIRIIWQEPCFEAVLLRQLAHNAVRQEWPQYQKPMNRAELARRIDREAVTRAAGVENDLMALLRCIGLIPPED